MTNHVIAICILLVALTAIVAFIAGAVFALRYQRRLMRRTGFVQIGSDLYRAELVVSGQPEKPKRPTLREHQHTQHA